MTQRTSQGGLQVATVLNDLLTHRICPGTGLGPAAVWAALENIVAELAPKVRSLLVKRDELQARIDAWHRARAGQPHDAEAYRRFLTEIGYLLPEGPDFSATTASVDAEVAVVAGPQLVVPVTNARYALNAANARWGSLYDALYGTDVIPETDGCKKSGGYNPARGAKVIAFAREFLDKAAPLARGSHKDASTYSVQTGNLLVTLADRTQTTLADKSKFAGYAGQAAAPTAVLLVNHGLHIEIHFDRAHAIGKTDTAGIKDVVLESAVTTIQDFEDSVATVDAADKALAYANWLGLIQGDLSETFEKGGRPITRTLHPDRAYTRPDGGTMTLPGRSLLFARNVGHHMFTDAVLDREGKEIPEGFLDALFTCLISLGDVKGRNRFRNSRAGSIYIVKPKMHGPEEVALTCELFSRVEDALGLPRGASRSASWTRNAAPPSISRNVSAPRKIAWCSSTPVFSTARAMKFTPAWRPGRWSVRTP